MHPALLPDPTDIDQPPLLLTPRQAAQLLSISDSTLRRITAPRGSLPCVRVGRDPRYRRETLERWIAEQEAGHAGA